MVETLKVLRFNAIKLMKSHKPAGQFNWTSFRYNDIRWSVLSNEIWRNDHVQVTNLHSYERSKMGWKNNENENENEEQNKSKIHIMWEEIVVSKYIYRYSTYVKWYAYTLPYLLNAALFRLKSEKKKIKIWMGKSDTERTNKPLVRMLTQTTHSNIIWRMFNDCVWSVHTKELVEQSNGIYVLFQCSYGTRHITKIDYITKINSTFWLNI